MAIIVFDLDGTLACGKHRLHLLPKAEDSHLTEAWDAFNLACVNDAVIEDNARLLEILYEIGHYILILTGRSDVAALQTHRWLLDNGIRYSDLIMRSRNDHRRDVEFKEDELRKVGLSSILCCFDDLEHVAKHIRSLGVTCHLVTHYDAPRVDTVERK